MSLKSNDIPENRTEPFFLWLIIGAVLMSFSNWGHIIPLAPWLYPVFFIRYFRSRPTGSGTAVLLTVCMAAGAIMCWPALKFQGATSSFLISSGMGVGFLTFLPFLADRLIAPKIKGFLSTLVFPTAWVTVEYLNYFSPNATWGSLAYTQYGALPFMQLASITGIWGLSFMVAWTAPVVNRIWENNFSMKEIKGGLTVYALILILILVWGGARLAFYQLPENTVCVGGITNPDSTFFRFDKKEWHDRSRIRNRLIEEQDLFLEWSRNAARCGAKIICWQEYAIWVLEEDESSFIKKACDFAREEGVYLVAPYANIPEKFPTAPWENKLVWIGPDGDKLLEYHKAHPSYVLEPIKPGPGVVPLTDTPWGGIASIICTDQEYPGFVRQAGKKGAGLLVVPSAGWKGVTPLHTHMAAFRAVENGFSLFKPIGEGLSAVIDSRGRIISSMDYWAVKDRIMISHAPVKKFFTVYGIIGDAFAWLCIAFFIGAVACVLIRRK